MTNAVPAGVRAASALLWTATASSAFVVVSGFAVDRHVVDAIPSLAKFAAYPGQDPADLVRSVIGALWLQVIIGGIAVAGCVADAIWVRRPTGNARVAAFAVPIVLIPLLGLLLGGSAAAAAQALAEATGEADLADAYHHLLPSWFGLATQYAEIGIIVALVASLLIIVQGRYSDYYQRGRVEATATFWASDKLRQD